MRFYLDEDVRHALLMAARQRGIDVVATAEAGRRGASDVEQLAFATAAGRVLVTHNAGDFAVLHRRAIEAGSSHAGIVVLSRQRFGAGEYAAALERLAGRYPPEEMAGRLEYLANWL